MYMREAATIAESLLPEQIVLMKTPNNLQASTSSKMDVDIVKLTPQDVMRAYDILCVESYKNMAKHIRNPVNDSSYTVELREAMRHLLKIR